MKAKIIRRKKIDTIIFIITIFSITNSIVKANPLNKEELAYSIDLFGSASSGSYSPFWVTSNTYGINNYKLFFKRK